MGRGGTFAAASLCLPCTGQVVPKYPQQWLLWREAGYRYYIGKCFARCSVAVRFDPDAMTLICLPEGSEETIRLPVQGITKAELMGELAALQALPNYQLALPFSLEAWRQLEYAQNLTGTTL